MPGTPRVIAEPIGPKWCHPAQIITCYVPGLLYSGEEAVEVGYTSPRDRNNHVNPRELVGRLDEGLFGHFNSILKSVRW